MPVDGRRDAVEVLVELPREARLADAGDAGDGDEVGFLLLGRNVEEILDLPQLAVASDERCFETVRLERAAQAGDDALRLPERGQALLALELERAGVLVDDRLLRRAARRVADEHGAGVGGRLHARGGVDEVACDHAFAFGADCDGGLAGEDARAGAKLFAPGLLPERGDGGDEVEGSANRPLRIVLSRGRCSPHGHHRVADELLHRPAVQLDQPPARVEVAREQLAGLLGVALLR